MQLGETAGGGKHLSNSWPQTRPVFMSTGSPIIVSPPHTGVCPKSSLTQETWWFCRRSRRRPQGPGTECVVARRHPWARFSVCPGTAAVSLPLLTPATTKFTPEVPERTADVAALSGHMANGAIFSTHFNFLVQRPCRALREPGGAWTLAPDPYLSVLSVCSPRVWPSEHPTSIGRVAQSECMFQQMPFSCLDRCCFAFGIFGILVVGDIKFLGKKLGRRQEDTNCKHTQALSL